MSDSPPDQCARCGDSIRGQRGQWLLDPEWRMYLDDERDLRWFPTTPVVICCSSCKTRLEDLENSLSERRAYGSDADAEEIEAKIHRVPDDIELDRIVDQGSL